MLDKAKLRSKLALAEMTDTRLADEVGIARQSVSMKMNGKRQFTSNEISKIAHVLKLTPEDVMEIFFAPDVDESAT